MTAKFSSRRAKVRVSSAQSSAKTQDSLQVNVVVKVVQAIVTSTNELGTRRASLIKVVREGSKPSISRSSDWLFTECAHPVSRPNVVIVLCFECHRVALRHEIDARKGTKSAIIAIECLSRFYRANEPSGQFSREHYVFV